MSRTKDISGKIFGKLTAIRLSHIKNKAAHWHCSCECGKETIVSLNNISRNHTQSCGCLLRAKGRNATHGLSSHPLHIIWNGIIQRCENKKYHVYNRYGKVGVTVCSLWRNDFKAFYDWANENGWEKGLPICRKGDIGEYSPDNCYISTLKQNNRDKKSNKLNMWKARVIRVMRSNHGWSHEKQSEFWGVSVSTISAVTNNRLWV